MKSRTKKHLIALALFAMVGIGTQAQDIHFSQFYLPTQNLNPAMAGANYDMHGIISYKSQWQSITNAYQTFGASYDMRIGEQKSDNTGIFAAGIDFFSDKAGDSKMGTTFGKLNLAYHLYIDDKNTIGAGIYGGYGQRSIDYTQLEWGNQYDGVIYNSNLPTGEGQGSTAFGFIDAGAGVVYSYKSKERYITANDQKSLNAGFSVSHIAKPNFSYYGYTSEKLHRKYALTVNGLIGIQNSRLSFAPAGMYVRQGPIQEILIGNNFRYMLVEGSKYTGLIKSSVLYGGVFYRTQDAVVATMGLEYQNYAFGISYDFNTSKLRAASASKGGIELHIRYVAPNPFQPLATQVKML